jgi:hypothetical protein
LKYPFLLLFLAFSAFLPAQEDEPKTPFHLFNEEAPARPKQFYVFSPRVSVTVPHPTGNESFKNCFVGIYEVSGGVNVYWLRGLFVGPTYKNALLKITENKVIDYNARLAINNLGIKVGGDVYLGEKNRIIFSASVTAGESWNNYGGQSAKNPERTYTTKYVNGFAEPEMNIFFLIESNFGIGATVSYSFFDHNFNPADFTLTDYSNFDYYKPGITRYLSFGFGFYYSLLRKKEKA